MHDTLYTAHMNRRHVFTALTASLIALALTGCGNKGPLVMPDKPSDTPVPADAPAQPAPAQPVTDGTPAAN